jgi:hypothetical protein
MAAEVWVEGVEEQVGFVLCANSAHGVDVALDSCSMNHGRLRGHADGRPVNIDGTRGFC